MNRWNKLSRIIFLKEPIINKLYLLLGVFLMTISAILLIENYFDHTYITKYRNEIDNQEQQRKIENLLKIHLLKLNIAFKSYRSISHEQQLSNNNETIQNLIEKCYEITIVLDEGGKVSSVKSVNLHSKDEITEVISYKRDKHTGSIKEIRELIPKIRDLNNLSNKISAHINNKLQGKIPNQEKYLNSIEFYIKQSDTYFERISEIENKISYDINKRLAYLHNTSINVVTKYNKLKYFSLFFFSLFAVIITYFLISQIRSVIIFRRKAEESNKKLLLAVEQSPISIMITDTSGNIEYVNKGFEDVSGLSKHELTGHSANLLKSEIEDSTFANVLWQTVQEGKVWTGELNNRRKDGSIYWEKVLISPVLSEDKTISNYVVIKEDITEKRNLTESLRESNESMKTITENLPVGILIVNTRKEIIQINHTAAKTMGFNSIEEAITRMKGLTYKDFFNTIKKDYYTDPTTGIKVTSLEEILEVKENNISREILKNILPIRLNNEPVFLEAFMDISVQKEVQKKKRKLIKPNLNF